MPVCNLTLSRVVPPDSAGTERKSSLPIASVMDVPIAEATPPSERKKVPISWSLPLIFLSSRVLRYPIGKINTASRSITHPMSAARIIRTRAATTAAGRSVIRQIWASCCSRELGLGSATTSLGDINEMSHAPMMVIPMVSPTRPNMKAISVLQIMVETTPMMMTSTPEMIRALKASVHCFSDSSLRSYPSA